MAESFRRGIRINRGQSRGIVYLTIIIERYRNESRRSRNIAPCRPKIPEGAVTQKGGESRLVGRLYGEPRSIEKSSVYSRDLRRFATKKRVVCSHLEAERGWFRCVSSASSQNITQWRDDIPQ